MKPILLAWICLISMHVFAQESKSVKERLKHQYDFVFYQDGNKFYFQDKKSFYIISIGEKKGICDLSGKEIIPPEKYSQVAYVGFKKGYFSVRIGDKVGICNLKGEEVLPPLKYNSIRWNGDDDFYVVSIGDKSGICDLSGKEVIPPIYDSNYCGSEGLWPAKKDGKYGYLNIKTGDVVIPFEYDDVSWFQDGTARVTKNGEPLLLVNPLITSNVSNTIVKAKTKVTSSYPAPNSDVDTNIPQGATASKHTFAFIVANENYPVAKVPYALNDGWIFERYCKQTLGIPDEHVKIFEDATGGNLITCIEQIKDIAKAYEGDASIIFYYAGHAFPDEEKSTAYLLPIDGDSKNPATGYSLEKLYSELNSVPTKSVICFLDACFSGATRDDEMLLTGRGVAIKVRDEIPQGNMIVFTSATGAETAHQFEEKGHGLFTYYLLQKLQESRGDITLGELAEYIRKMVRRKSVLINQKMQTPMVIPSPAISENWQSLKL